MSDAVISGRKIVTERKLERCEAWLTIGTGISPELKSAGIPDVIAFFNVTFNRARVLC